MPHSLDAKRVDEALRRLDGKLSGDFRLVVGGGAAMAIAYDHPLATKDVDAFLAKGADRLAELAQASHEVAREMDIAADWLNPYYETFAFVLPPDYPARLRAVFRGRHVEVLALGPEDLLIMKCFAHRQKDVGHARALVKLAADLDVVERRLSELMDKGYPGAEAAADFFDDLRDERE